jgi:tetratricopeptide (TPR) repeat protein
MAYADLGKTEQAIEFFEQALLIFCETGYRRGEANNLGNLGRAYIDLGETERGIQLYEHALLIAREIGDRRGEATALWNMSLALNQLGERPQAILHAEEALAIYEQIHMPQQFARNSPSGARGPTRTEDDGATAALHR